MSTLLNVPHLVSIRGRGRGAKGMHGGSMYRGVVDVVGVLEELVHLQIPQNQGIQLKIYRWEKTEKNDKKLQVTTIVDEETLLYCRSPDQIKARAVKQDTYTK